jgi:hypothetical protein
MMTNLFLKSGLMALMFAGYQGISQGNGLLQSVRRRT